MKRTAFRKFTSLILAFIMILPNITSVFAASVTDFVDFPFGWSNEAVTAAVNNGLLNGRTANTIEPEGNLTRAEMATIINRAFGATIEKNISAFGDVSPNEWYYHEIAKAYNMQTFQGDDTVTMRPDAFITREEVFAVIARALVLETSDYSSIGRFNDSYAVSEWAKPYASILVQKGYVNGDNLGNLNPLANITREEFAQIMHNIVKTYHVTAGSHTYAGPASTLIRVGGVTLSNVTVEGDLILGDGVGKGDVTLINVTIKGRLLARGGEGKVTLTNTTVAGGVVVKDVNGVVNFNNYRTEAPFVGIREITKATFIGEAASQGGSTGGSTGGGGGGGGSGPGPAPSAKTVTITYNANGGSVSQTSVTISMNGKISSLPTPTRAGHTFVGWYKNAEGTGDKITTSTTFSASTTIYAKWTKNKYNVSIDAPNGQDKNIEYEYEETIGSKLNFNELIPGGKLLEDYKFYNKATGETVSVATKVTSAMEIGFKEAKVVTFNYGYDNKIDTRKVFEGEKLSDKYFDAVRTGYKFDGWFTTGGERADANTVINDAITLTARWTANKYNINYVSKTPQGSEIAFSTSFKDNANNFKFSVDADFPLPEDDGGVFVAHSDYEFDGWYLTSDASDTNKITKLTKDTYFEDVTLYARWNLKSDIGVNRFVVTVNLAPYADSYTITLPKDTVLSSGEFVLENTEKGKSKGYYITNFTGYDFTQPLTSHITITATWTPIVYTIIYHIEDNGLIASDASFVGVTGEQSFTVASGNVALYTKENVDCTGIELLSWHLSSTDGPKLPTHIDPDDYIGGSEQIHLYAKWDWKKFTVNVASTTEPGAENHKYENVVYNTTVGQLNVPTFTRRGYKYTKFSTTGTNAGDIYELGSSIISNLTIYPVWEKENYTVILRADDKNTQRADRVVFSNGEPNEQTRDFTIDVETGSPLSLPDASEFANTDAYDFMGWYDEYDDSSKTFTGKIDDNKIDSISFHNNTLYARWDVKKFEVTFVLSDGNVTKTYEYGAELDYIPTREGYGFESWTSSSGEPLITGARIYKDYTLTPNWNANTYYVNLVADPTGETGIVLADSTNARFSFTIEELRKTIPSDVSFFTGSDNYDFMGWYTGYNVSTKEYTGKVETINHISDAEKYYYAKWAKKKYDITFDGYETVTREHGAAINYPVTKDGYTFVEWEDPQGNKYSNTSPVTGHLTLNPVWDLNTYYVNLNADPKGFGDIEFVNPSDASYAFNVEMLTPSKALPVEAAFSFNPDKYTFEGWYANSEYTGQKITDIKSILDAGNTYYAKWARKEYTVTFNGYGEKTYYYDDMLGSDGIAGVPYEIEGYETVEWNTAQNGSGTKYTATTKITGDITLYLYHTGIKEYSITYVGEGAAFEFDPMLPINSIPKKYTVEDILMLPFEVIALSDGSEDLSRRFAGWYKDAGLTQALNEINKGTTGNLTLYPKFVNVDAFLVYFVNFDGPEVYEIQTVYQGGKATKPAQNPSMTGKEFAGWYYIEMLPGGQMGNLREFDFNTVITDDIEIIAMWDDIEFTVYYKYPDKAVSSSGILYGNKLSQIIYENGGYPVKDGYTFIGWTLTEGSETVQYAEDYIVTEEITGTLYPVWEPVLYSIVLNENPTFIPGISPKDYSAIDTDFYITDLEDDGFKLPEASDYNAPDEYRFDGWYTRDDFSSSKITHITDISQAFNTYYAKWVRKTFSVDYVYSDGDVPSSAEIPYGDSLSNHLGTPARKGYTHDGWINEYDEFYSTNHSVTEAIRGTLSPFWKANTYSIVLIEDSQGLGASEKYPEQIVKEFTTDSLPVNLPAEDKYNAPVGYRFDGWYTDSSFTNKVTQIADVDQAESITTYFAKWVKKIITVKYVYDDSVAPSDASIEYGDTLAGLGIPSKEGCKFLGWTKTKGSADVDYVSTDRVTEEFENADFVLYPVWEKIVYTIEYTHKPDTITVKEANPSQIKKEFTVDDVKDNGFALPAEDAFEVTEGYTLEGWYPNGSEAIEANRVERITAINQAGKYWANWVKRTYSVLVYSDGSTSKVTFTHGDTISSKIDAPIPSDGYIFDGWFVNSDGTGTSYKGDDTVTGAFDEGTVLYPVFSPKPLKLTYVYDKNEFILYRDEIVDFDVTKEVQLYTSADFKENKDWKFDGWYYNGTKIEKLEKGRFTSDVTVEARWARIYHVTYNYNYAGSSTVTKDVLANSLAQELSVPDRSNEGWKFAGWQLNGVAYNFATPVNADITLVAKWERIKYDVTFVVDGVETLTAKYEHDAKLSSNKDYKEPSKKGYTFEKWVDSDGSYVTSSGEVTKSLRLTAVWSAPITYTLTYDVGAGPSFKQGVSSTVTFTVLTDSFSLLDEAAFADLTGFTFLGWKINGVGDYVSEFEKGKYAENITLMAQWKNAYYVAFNTDGGEADNPDKIKTQKITEGEKADKPEVTLTKPGYTFMYWELNGQEYKFTENVTNNITLKAKWRAHSYTVEYNINGVVITGTQPSDDEFTYDTQSALPVLSARGYEFSGWTVASDGSGEVLSGIKAYNLTTEDGARVILYAKWSENEYTISYNANTGSGTTAQQNFKYTNVPEFLSANGFTKTGYSFMGWALENDKEKVVYSDGAAASNVLDYIIEKTQGKSITLYAVWKPISYFVSYNSNGGTGSMENSVFTYDAESMFSANGFERSGYKFKGWEYKGQIYIPSTTYQKLNLSNVHDSVVEVFAKWEPISYTVRYHHGVSQSQASNVSGTTNDSIHTFDDEKALTENGFERTGYTFKGWTTTPPAGIYSLMNVFSLRTQADDEQVASDSDEIASSDGETKVDYTNGQDVKNLADEDGDVVILYAVWEANKYKVVYFEDGKYIGGWPSKAYEATYDEQFVLYNLNTVFSEGYDFVEWNTKQDGTGDSYKAGESVMNLTSEPDATVVLYPISTERIYYVQLKYRDDTNAVVPDGEYLFTDTYTFPGNRGYKRTGYTFAGWVNFPDNLSNPTYVEGDTRSKFHIANGSTITYYAAWTPNKYKVSFNVDGGKPLTDAEIPSDASYSFENGKWVLTVTYDSEYPVLPRPQWVDNKKNFAYWTLSDGTKLVAGQTVKITDETVLTAVWTDEIVHTVIFKDYYLSGEDYVTDVVNAYAIEKPQDPPAREGYTFGGWFEDIYRTEPFDFITPTAEDSSVTYTAYPKWIAHRYEIIFNGNGATSGSMNSQGFKYDSEQKLKANSYVKPGYIFDGWTVNSDGTGTYYENEATILNLTSVDGAKITLYAKWKASPYTVEFDGNGAQGVMNSLTFNYTDSVSLPENAYTKDGYTFLGWSENKNATVPSYKDKASKEEFIKALLQSSEGRITLYAIWGENNYTIAFDGNGAQEGSMSSITLGYNVSQALPENNFTRAGYSFKGWNTKADGSGISYEDKATVKGITATDGATVTLYAQWKINEYSVSFDMNGASGNAEPVQTVAHGNLAAKPANPFKYGYDFIGWYYGNSEFDFATPITKDINLKAMWNAAEVTIKFIDDRDEMFTTKAYFGGKIERPADPTKEYYEFDGWYSNRTLTMPFDFDNYTVNNIFGTNIYSKWKVAEYDITYATDGGRWVVDEDTLPNSYTHFDGVILPDETQISRPGYGFNGWHIVADESEDTSLIDRGIYEIYPNTESGDIILKAIWQKASGGGVTGYDVYFRVDGELYASITYSENEVLSDGNVKNPEKNGYTFVQWIATDGTVYSDGTPITESVTLNAQWKAVKYSITYNLVGGHWKDGAVYATSYTIEDEVVLSEDVENGTTKVFNGWLTTDESLGEITPPGALDLNPPPAGYYRIKKIPVGTTGDLELVAHWGGTSGGGPGGDENEKFKVELIVDGEQYLAGEILKDSPIGIGFIHYTNPTKAGYEFVEWNTKSDGTGTKYDPYTTGITEEVILYAIWNKLPLESYTITYNNIETSDMANASAFVLSYTKEDEITLPKLSDFNERADGKVFAGWYDNAEFNGTALTSIPKGSTENKVFWAKWEQSFIVRFHRGAIAVNESHRKYIGDVRVAAGTAMAQSDIDAMISGVNKKVLVEYYDGSYSHTVNGELWYVDNGEWKIFNSEVKINADTDVFYANKFVSLCLNVELGGFTLDIPGYISVPYSTDTKLIESAKDLMTAARSKLLMALSTDDIYARAIEKAAQKTSEKDINLIDADGNLKFVDIDTAISSIIKPEEIDGEIEKYIETIIVDNRDDEKIESAILMVYNSELIKDTVLGGMSYDFEKVKTYITNLSAEERKEFADHVHDILENEQYYHDFIDAFEKGHDHFVVSHENLDFVMAVATAVKEYTYEQLKDKIYARFGKVIDVLGDDIAKEFMADAQVRYYEGAHILWDDMKAHLSDENYKSSYPSYLTFKVNAVDHVFKPMFDKYRVKVIDKLIEKDFYHYTDNTYLRELVEMDADTIVNDLLYKVPVTEENIGYALWPSENGESGFMHYYDYLFHKLLIADNARLWYVNNLTESELEELRTSVYENIAKALNKANEMLASYEKDGSLPMGKNISDLMEIEAFAKIFNKVEGKLLKILEKFKTTQFYGKEWTADSVRYDVPYSDLAGNVILGTDEPAFNVDSLLDDKYVGKALNKAGFKEFEDSFDADIGSTVTVQAIERLFRNNRIEIRRYYE